MLIFTRVRLSLAFHNNETRLQFVMARLQALSVLVYSNSLQENINNLLYPGFLEELVELLEMRETKLVEIRAAALRTLTSIIHLDRNPNFPKCVPLASCRRLQTLYLSLSHLLSFTHSPTLSLTGSLAHDL